MSFLKWIILTICSLKDWQNFFTQSSTLYRPCWFSLLPNVHIVDIDIPKRNMFMCFYCGWFFRNFCTTICSFSQIFQICINNRCHLIRFLSNFNMLVSSEKIARSQYFLFPYTFFWDSSLFFVLSERKQFKQWKLPQCFEAIPFNNADSLVFLLFFSVWNH